MRYLVITLVCGTILAIGCVLGSAWRSRNLRVGLQERWQQGYDTGRRVGWYEASDQLAKDAVTIQANYGNRTDLNITVSYVEGWEDAAARLHNYWDKTDGIKDE